MSVGMDGDVCVEAQPNNYGVVYVYNQHIKCSTCKRGQTTCIHVQYVHSLLQFENQSVELHPALNIMSALLSCEKSALGSSPTVFEVPDDSKHIFTVTRTSL